MATEGKIIGFLDLPPELRLKIYHYATPVSKTMVYKAWAKELSCPLRPDSTIRFLSAETSFTARHPLRFLCKTTRNEIGRNFLKSILILSMLDWDNIPIVENTVEWKFPSEGSVDWKRVQDVVVLLWRQDNNEDSRRWIAKVATFIARLDAHLGKGDHKINTLTFKVEEKFLRKYADNDWANKPLLGEPYNRPLVDGDYFKSLFAREMEGKVIENIGNWEIVKARGEYVLI